MSEHGRITVMGVEMAMHLGRCHCRAGVIYRAQVRITRTGQVQLELECPECGHCPVAIIWQPPKVEYDDL